MSIQHKEHQILLRCVADDFERLATTLERAVQAFANADDAGIDFDGLQRARDVARYGAEISRNLLNNMAKPT